MRAGSRLGDGVERFCGSLALLDAAAANINASGARGMLRAQGSALLFASVLRVWVNDDDPGHARTMAALDRALARAQRWSGFFDDLCRIPRCIGRARRRRRPDFDDGEEESVAV